MVRGRDLRGQNDRFDDPEVGHMRAKGTRAKRRRTVVAACVATAAVALVGCGGGTQELASDGSDGLDGPLPTAPNGSSDNGVDLGAGDPFSGSVDVNDLIRRIDALNEETDLCTLLTGQAMSDLTTADINLASLASNPAAFSQLFASLDKLFGHMIVIGPPELTPPLTTLQGVWGGLSDVDIRGADAESRASALLANEDTQAANDALGAWVAVNCPV